MPKDEKRKTSATPPEQPARRLVPGTTTKTDSPLLAGLDVKAAEEEIAAHPELFETYHVDISELVDSPFNPLHRAHDEAELQDILPSIIENGVMSHLIVVDRELLLRNSPQLAPKVPATGRWVIAAGHRRKGGAYLASLPKYGGRKPIVPIAVRNEWATALHLRRIMLQENLLRMGITPTEEAEQYRGLRDEEKMTIEAIAQLVGVSKGHVSKRIKLLDLPAPARQLVDEKRLSIDSAQELFKIPEADREFVVEQALRDADDAATRSGDPEPDLRVRLKPYIQAELARAQREQAAEKVRAELAQRGISEVSPAELWGEDAWRHRVKPEDVDAEHASGGIAGATIEDGRPVFFSTEDAPHLRPAPVPAETVVHAPVGDDAAPGQPTTNAAQARPVPVSPPPAPQRSELEIAAEKHRELLRQAHEDAAANRRDACRRLVADLGTLRNQRRNDLLDLMAEGTLYVANLDEHGRPRPVSLDGDLLRELIGDADVAALNTDQLDRNTAQLVAISLSLVAAEGLAAHPSNINDEPWPPVVNRYLTRLNALGFHTLSEYETKKLA